jgi:hypothetical protein
MRKSYLCKREEETKVLCAQMPWRSEELGMVKHLRLKTGPIWLVSKKENKVSVQQWARIRP